MTTQNIYNLIILDASGSMSSIYNQALAGVNETIATIRMAQQDHPNMRQFLTLVSFSAGEHFLNRIYSAMPIDEVRDITPEDYPLLGCTALYDAMGTTISELQQRIKHDDRVLVTVITDGYENASQTWNGPQIKSLVEELRQMGWTFTYIGADQDVDRVAGSIGVRNALRFASNAQSTQAMFAHERKSRMAYYGKMHRMMEENMPTMCEDAAYFTSEPNDQEAPTQQTPTSEPQPTPKARERDPSFLRRILGKK